jgi:hypothetical protein
MKMRWFVVCGCLTTAIVAACGGSGTDVPATGDKGSGGKIGSGKGGSSGSTGGTSTAGTGGGVGTAGTASVVTGMGGTGSGAVGGAAGSAGSTTPAGGTTGSAGTTGVGGTGGDGNLFGAGGGAGTPGTGGTGTMPGCIPTADTDLDQDGWTPGMGDCNDCDANVNPGAIDVINYEIGADGKPTDVVAAMQFDEDCDGSALQPGQAVSCDDNLPVGGVADAFDAAKAIGLCNVHVEQSPSDPKQRKWGVIDAKFVNIDALAFDGQSTPYRDLDFGILPDFGSASKPQEGSRVLGLSSGEARTPSQPGYKGDNCNFLKAYPSSFPGLGSWPKNGSCGATGTPWDGVALDLRLRMPTNAKAISFDFRFFTCEYPEYACEIYNDVFAVLMVPTDGGQDPLPSSDPMYPDVAFETTGTTKNVIGVNNESFLTACTLGTTDIGNYPNCKGEAELAGSGFENHAASAWLRSQVPVTGGREYILRIAIWDSQDANLDSTAIMDNVKFIAEAGIIDPRTGVITDPH